MFKQRKNKSSWLILFLKDHRILRGVFALVY